MSRLQFSRILLLASLASLTPFAVDMYLPSFGDIVSSLGADMDVVQLTISFFLLVLGLGQLVFGPVTDYMGRRPVIIFALILFFCSSLLAAASKTIEWLMLARVLQAVAGSAIGVCVMASVRDYFSGNDLAKASSYLMMVVIIAPMVAPLIGGQILLFLSWPWIFVVLATLAVANLIAYLLLGTESLAHEHRQPLGIKTAFRSYWGILSDRASTSYILISGFSSAAMFVFITSSSFVYIEYFQVSKQQFGWLFAANILLMMAVSFLNTRLLNYFSWSTILKWSVYCRFIPAIGLIVVCYWVQDNQFEWLVLMVVLNIGLIPLVGANAQTGLMDRHGKKAGSAAALVGSFRFVSGGIAGFLLSFFEASDFRLMVWGMCVAVICMFLSYMLLLSSSEKAISS